MKISHTGQGNIGSRLTGLGSEPLPIKDINDAEEVRNNLLRVKPDVIIHTACVSSPEECEKDYEKAIYVNFRGTQVLCEVAEEVIGAGRVVLLSTDHVFDGEKGDYTEEDEPNPINDYGKTKLAAEGAMVIYGGKIIRLSRGFDSKSRDIVSYRLALSSGLPVYVPDFIRRSYCHMDFQAGAVWEYANRFDEMPDMLHLGGDESCTYQWFISKAAEAYGFDSKQVLTRTEPDDDFARRPFLCGLNVTKAHELGFHTPLLHDSINRMKNER